jgi:hypothetical protein
LTVAVGAIVAATVFSSGSASQEAVGIGTAPWRGVSLIGRP